MDECLAAEQNVRLHAVIAAPLASGRLGKRKADQAWHLVGLGGSYGKRSPTTTKKARKPARNWAYPDEFLREIGSALGSYAELARRYGVHTETVTRAKRLYRAD